MRIAALDFETASPVAGSICSVGIATYTHGTETESFSSLIRPHVRIYAGRWYFQHIHGISRDEVTDSPEFPDIIPQIASLLCEADLVVCHNASFDIGQLRAVLAMYDTYLGEFVYACTCRTSRKLLPGLRNYKLSTVAEAFQFPFHHHDALDDARAAGFIMAQLTKNCSAEEIRQNKHIALHTFHMPRQTGYACETTYFLR